MFHRVFPYFIPARFVKKLCAVQPVILISHILRPEELKTTISQVEKNKHFSLIFLYLFNHLMNHLATTGPEL